MKKPFALNSSNDNLHIAIQKKRRFLYGLALFFFSYFLILPVLTSLTPGVLLIKVGSVPFAWILAFSKFLMTGLVCILYMYRIKRYDRMLAQLTSKK